jgi:transcriptional regulator with XRE-family HTH domain
MVELRKRFGTLVAAHRKRRAMTQADLAHAAGLSPTMIVRIENGSSGTRFPAIERISRALEVDPSELFVVESNRRSRARPALVEINTKLTGLSDRDLTWVGELLDVALRSRG